MVGVFEVGENKSFELLSIFDFQMKYLLSSLATLSRILSLLESVRFCFGDSALQIL